LRRATRKDGAPASEAHLANTAWEEAVWRRAFIILLGGAVTSLYSADCSAQSRVYRLGLLPAARNPLAIEALQDGLRRLGYIEGQNLKTEYRFRESGVATLDSLLLSSCALSPTSL
jgi:hypothetical protein